MRFATAPSQERACALQRARLTSKPIHHCSLQRSGYNLRAYLLAWRCQRTSPSRSNRPNSIFTWLSGSAQDAPQDVSPGYKGQGGWGKGGEQMSTRIYDVPGSARLLRKRKNEALARALAEWPLESPPAIALRKRRYFGWHKGNHIVISRCQP